MGVAVILPLDRSPASVLNTTELATGAVIGVPLMAAFITPL